MKRLLALILMGLLVAGGCDRKTTITGGDEGSKPPPTPTPSASPTPESEEDLVARAAALGGSWTGTWKNLTFGSQGVASAQVTVDQATKTFTIALDLGGNVFGGSDPPPQTFEGSLDGRTNFQGTTSLFGSYTAAVNTNNNTFTFDAPDVPGDRVQSMKGSGKLEGENLTATVTITFPDGTTAESSLEMTKA